MVELEVEDYNELFDWFTLAFGIKPEKISPQAKSTFWKLNFLAEDKMKEAKLLGADTKDVDE